MMKKLLLTTIILGGYIAAANAADDSVYVDLSVLNSLSNDAAVAVSEAPEPRFPIVKKKPAPKKVVKAAKKVEPVIEVKAPLEEKKAEPAAPVVAETKPEPQQIPYVQDAEPVVVVDVEPVAAAPKPETETVPAVAEPAAAEPMTETAPEKPAAQQEEAVAEPEKTAAAPQLLIDDTAPVLPKVSAEKRLVFADDVDELTDEQRGQIDAVVASFADAVNNKIAIYAYNQDDGEDAFRKKRLSLNRAVAVRSYLLPKGYKNFSIKVVNVDAASGKANTVELEELK